MVGLIEYSEVAPPGVSWLYLGEMTNDRDDDDDDVGDDDECQLRAHRERIPKFKPINPQYHPSSFFLKIQSFSWALQNLHWLTIVQDIMTLITNTIGMCHSSFHARFKSFY